MQKQFTATVKKDGTDPPLSAVYGMTRGNCDDVQTFKGQNQGCGLAKYLVATCFQDEMILGPEDKGVDVSKDDGWNQEDRSTDASNYCKTITYLRCLPYGTRGSPKPPNRVCVSYLRAGRISNFNILFTKTESATTLKAFKLGEALEQEFTDSFDMFIRDNGNIWYFCKW